MGYNALHSAHTIVSQMITQQQTAANKERNVTNKSFLMISRLLIYLTESIETNIQYVYCYISFLIRNFKSCFRESSITDRTMPTALGTFQESLFKKVLYSHSGFDVDQTETETVCVVFALETSPTF